MSKGSEFWQQRLDEYKTNMKEAHEWMIKHWEDIPESVKFLLIQGEIRCSDKIREYEPLLGESGKK